LRSLSLYQPEIQVVKTATLQFSNSNVNPSPVCVSSVIVFVTTFSPSKTLVDNPSGAVNTVNVALAPFPSPSKLTLNGTAAVEL
jgi:hypothetical protein